MTLLFKLLIYYIILIRILGLLKSSNTITFVMIKGQSEFLRNFNDCS